VLFTFFSYKEKSKEGFTFTSTFILRCIKNKIV